MNQPVRIGLLRLADSAPVLVARERGLFERLGLDVTISIEPSWSNLADKLTYGMLDAAVMLPPLVLAAALGLRGRAAKLAVIMGISHGGNAIVVSNRSGAWGTAPGQPIGRMMLDWIRTYRRDHDRAPRFAVVHRFSTHNLLLRYWLAAAGADPERHVETVVIPPEQVAPALADGRIEGFCAGAPWGDVAREAGAGRILLGSSAIWPAHPEKCLAVSEPWLDANPDTARLLVRALLQARLICAMPEETAAIAALLSRDDGLALPRDATHAALPGGTAAERVMFQPDCGAYPSAAHALWFLRQMRRWGWLGARVDLDAVAHRVYRPDILEAEGIPPAPDAKTPSCNIVDE
jgi:two-component system, oxyanion-binding sensor